MKWSDIISVQDTVYRDSKYSHDIDADLRDRSFWDKAVLDTKMLSYDAAMRTYSGLVEIDIKYMRTFILEEQGKTKSKQALEINQLRNQLNAVNVAIQLGH